MLKAPITTFQLMCSLTLSGRTVKPIIRPPEEREKHDHRFHQKSDAGHLYPQSAYWKLLKFLPTNSPLGDDLFGCLVEDRTECSASSVPSDITLHGRLILYIAVNRRKTLPDSLLIHPFLFPCPHCQMVSQAGKFLNFHFTPTKLLCI